MRKHRVRSRRSGVAGRGGTRKAVRLNFNKVGRGERHLCPGETPVGDAARAWVAMTAVAATAVAATPRCPTTGAVMDRTPGERRSTSTVRSRRWRRRWNTSSSRCLRLRCRPIAWLAVAGVSTTPIGHSKQRRNMPAQKGYRTHRNSEPRRASPSGGSSASSAASTARATGNAATQHTTTISSLRLPCSISGAVRGRGVTAMRWRAQAPRHRAFLMSGTRRPSASAATTTFAARGDSSRRRRMTRIWTSRGRDGGGGGGLQSWKRTQ